MEEYSSVPLPDGWVEYYDESNHSYYYYNEELGLSQWEPPDANQVDITSLNEDYSDVEEDDDDHEYVATEEVNDLNEYYTDSIAISDELPLTTSLSVFDYSDVDDSGTNPSTYRETENNWQTNTAIRLKRVTGGVNQDYLALAAMYKITRQYSDGNKNMACALCNKNTCTTVFFPCEHRCVCNECIEKEGICDESRHAKIVGVDDDSGHCNCALCGEIIKIMFEYDSGREVERYWEWVFASKPYLSNNFIKNFKHSAGVLECVYANDEFRKPSEIPILFELPWQRSSISDDDDTLTNSNGRTARLSLEEVSDSSQLRITRKNSQKSPNYLADLTNEFMESVSNTDDNCSMS